MKSSTAVLALLALVGSATSTLANPTWETRVRFTVAGTPTTDLVLPEATTQVSIILQAGIFNVDGLGANQANHGLSMWAGNVTSTLAGLGVNNATSRISPYNYGPFTSFGGFIAAGGTRIDGNTTANSEVFMARSIAPCENVVWPSGQPMPAGPSDFGVESYVDIFRFTFTFGANVFGTTTIGAAGRGGPVLRWVPFSVQEPADGQNGSVNFVGASVNPPTTPSGSASLNLTRLPSPGAAVLFAAPLFLRRRR